MSGENGEFLPLFGIVCFGVAFFYVCCRKIKSLKDEIESPSHTQIINEEVELLRNNRRTSELPPYKIRDDPPVYEV